MHSVQMPLVGANVLTLLAVLTGDLVGSTVLMTAGFAGVFLTLGLLAVVTVGALVSGVARSPVSMVPTGRTAHTGGRNELK